MSKVFSDMPDSSQCDVLIVGAGMVGASAAVGLSRLGLDVRVIDAFEFSDAIPDYTPSYDARSTALSWGTRLILEQLAVWPLIAEHACPITQVHVSEKGRFGTTRMHAEDYAQEALGYVVPNQCLGQGLLQQVYAQKVPIYGGTKVASIESQEPGSLVRLQSVREDSEQKQLRTKLVLVVDGTASETARNLGIAYQEEAYQQHALVVNVSTSVGHQGVAFERFTNKGPLAMLPLDENTCAVVWTHSETDIQRYLVMSDRDFCQALQDNFSERLGLIERCGKRSAYPLRLVKASEQCRSGILLLGNAAHSLHPVAGQGFNLAIRGVASFLAYVKEAQDQGLAYAELSGLNRFCQSLLLDQKKTIGMSDQLVKIFANDSSLLGLARDLGLIGMENITPLKSAFAQQAMGLAGRKALF